MLNNHDNLDDERANKMFSFFLITVGISSAMGFLLGLIVTLLFLEA